jgi:hypothetical protein
MMGSPLSLSAAHDPARDSGYSEAVNFGLRDASAREALKRLVD